MKKFSIVIAVVCLFTLCFTLLTACAGNADKVDDYLKKLNEEDNFINVIEVVNEAAKEKTVSEIIISGNKIQYLAVTYNYIDGKEKEEKGREEKYYEVLNDTTVREYSTFVCENPKHAKNGVKPTEWKFEDKPMVGNYLDTLRTTIRTSANAFNLKGENLVWDKAKKGFVYAEGKATPGFEDVVVTAKSGALTISYKALGVSYKTSYMNFGTSRVAFPLLCSDYADKLKK